MTSKGKVLVVVAGLAVGGVLIMLTATRLGTGVPPDATVYLDAARNFGAGHGLMVISGTHSGLVPLTHYPPLYSLLLALISTSGATVETAARWLNAILFGVNIFLIGLSLVCLARNSFWLPVTGAFLALTAPDLLANHSVAMTEPLYLALTFGGLLSLGCYLQNQRRGLLVLSALLVALSVLTRYVGIVGVVTGSSSLLLLQRDQDGAGLFGFRFRSEAGRRRVSDALIFITASCLPIALWSIRNRLATGGASDRQLAFHPPGSGQIVSAFSTVAQWLLLGKVRSDLRLLGFTIEVIVILSLTIYLLKQRQRANGGTTGEVTRLPHLLISFVVGYVGLLIFNMTFFESDSVLDGRSLLPVHFALLVLVPFWASRLQSRAPASGLGRSSLLVLVLLLAGSSTYRSARWLARAAADGQAYASRSWKESPTIALVRKLPSGVPIYSNGFDAIYYLTGRPALNLPERIVHGTGRANSAYQAEIERMSGELRTNQGVLVYFNTLPERWFLPSQSELKTELPLHEIATTADGSIYDLNPTSGNRAGH